MSCINANPDISGIGVRIAIYAQNILCFVPVIINLRDSEVSLDELESIEGQSVGILIIAFAVLISTIVQTEQFGLSSFHAAVVLNLSWMNNTSTFVWFVLWLHHRSKPDGDYSKEPIPRNLKEWVKALLVPYKRRDCKDSDSDPTPSGQVKATEIKLSNLVGANLVLILGSIHLSVMSAIGIWLWSNPSSFGDHMSCDPALVIFGLNIHFSSQRLRLVSLFIYSLFLIPLINLAVPFLFFLIPHILYNRVLRITRVDTDDVQILDSGRLGKRATRLRTTVLSVGLVFLFIVSILFLVDTELTISRAKHLQDPGEGQWGFGQVLSLLLLLVPVRDILSSIGYIERRRREVQARMLEDFSRDHHHMLEVRGLEEALADASMQSQRGTPSPLEEHSGNGIVEVPRLKELALEPFKVQ